MSIRITDKRWLSTKDLFLEFTLSLSSQAKLRSSLKIPFTKVGGKIFYDREQINKWLENHRVSSFEIKK